MIIVFFLFILFGFRLVSRRYSDLIIRQSRINLSLTSVSVRCILFSDLEGKSGEYLDLLGRLCVRTIYVNMKGLACLQVNRYLISDVFQPGSHIQGISQVCTH
jgi:hypothetical protein